LKEDQHQEQRVRKKTFTRLDPDSLPYSEVASLTYLYHCKGHNV